MEKQIKDYLHLYPGCICSHVEDPMFLVKLEMIDCDKKQAIVKGVESAKGTWLEGLTDVLIEKLKPHLRPLGSIKFNEVDQLAAWYGLTDKYGDIDTLLYDLESNHELRKMGTLAFITQYLLAKHFDLFGLIEAGLAIDATTLSTETLQS
jgi:hypothetical protein